MEGCRDAFKVLTGTPKGKRPLGWPWRRWEVNIYILYLYLRLIINGQ